MNRRRTRHSVLFLTTLAAAALLCDLSHCQPIVQVETARPNRVQIAVLQDGGVLTGEITLYGDRYLIRQPQGEINIATSRVLAICDSLQEAYQLQRHRGERTVESHLGLADWCLRHNLLPEAARELADARRLGGVHLRLALLERRLVSAGRPSDSHKPPKSPKSAATTSKGDQATESPPALLPPDLPEDVVEHFTRRVQPILVNNCTMAGCHQPGSEQSFQLDRALLHGLGNRRTTRSNLAATLTLVDREQPHLSPLLTIPRQAHGGMSGPVFTPRHRAAFSHLVDWVRIVTQSQPTAISEIAEPTADENPQTEEASYEADVLLANEYNERPKRRRVQFGAPSTGWRLKDEVNAESSNRVATPDEMAEPGEKGPADAGNE
jgi:hypothetical protein